MRKAYILILATIVSISCSTKQDSSNSSLNCHTTNPVKKTIEIEFSDTSAYDFIHSPFKKDKLWIRFSGEKSRIVEVEILTNKSELLSVEYTEIFSRAKNLATYNDIYDSIIWIGGSDNLLKYDTRTEKLQELALKDVRNIIPTLHKVYFVAYNGLYYLNRNNDSISKLESVPHDKIRTSKLIDSNTLILDNKYTFNLNNSKYYSTIYYDNSYFSEPYRLINCEAEILLLEKWNRIYLKQKGKTLQLTSFNDNNVPLHIFLQNNMVLQISPDSVFVYNLNTEKTERFWYRIPKLNSFSPNYLICDNYVWYYRPNQIFLISINENSSLKYSLKEEDNFKKLLIDDCNVYLLYSNKIEIFNKDRFIQECILFDGKAYEKEINSYLSDIDSLEIFNDTSQYSVLIKLKFLQEKYFGLDNVEVNEKLKMLEKSAFNKVKKEFPVYYEACYKNEDLPLAYRKKCINYLMWKNAHDGNAKEIIELDKEYRKFIGIPESEYFDYKSNLASVSNFIAINDSLNNIGVINDSIEYLKAYSYLTLCRTSWFNTEASCFDYNLAHQKLKEFIYAYPNSLLVDNAEYNIFITGLCGEGGFDISELQTIILQYKKLLTKYPDTDLRLEIEKEINDIQSELKKIEQI